MGSPPQRLLQVLGEGSRAANIGGTTADRRKNGQSRHDLWDMGFKGNYIRRMRLLFVLDDVSVNLLFRLCGGAETDVWRLFTPC